MDMFRIYPKLYVTTAPELRTTQSKHILRFVATHIVFGGLRAEHMRFKMLLYPNYASNRCGVQGRMGMQWTRMYSVPEEDRDVTE